MEHLHFSLKMVLKSLLGNVTKKSAQRIARSLETLDEIMYGIRKDLDQKKKKSGDHGTKDPEQAVKIITDVKNGNVFHHAPGRCGYPSLKNMRKSVIDIDFRHFFKEMAL